MQYLLTEEEFAALRATKRRIAEAEKAEIQRVCTLAAEHAPIVRDWETAGTPLRPWGCILTKDPTKHPGYCDECPVQDLCPHERKEYSQ